MGLYLHNIARKRTVEYASLDQNCCFGKKKFITVLYPWLRYQETYIKCGDMSIRSAETRYTRSAVALPEVLPFTQVFRGFA
jgi:hypothetical protein